MKKIEYIFIALTFLFLLACEESTSIETENDLLVVSAFLYAGQPVEDVVLTTTLPLGSEDTLAPPVTSASISLIKNGVNYELISITDKAGYYHYAGTDLIVEEQDQFELIVNYSDQQLTGETVVPKKPVNVSIDDDVVRIPDFGSGFPPGDFDREEMMVTIKWDNPEGDYFYVVMENIEENPESIETGPRGMGPRRFISAPVKAELFNIMGMNLTHLGQHRAIVYRVNQEYADLYESRQQDSRNLNEPLTNIQNGLGVFSAFASDTVYFELKQD